MKTNTMQFDKEEQQILQDFENGEFRSIRNFETEKQKLEEAARNTLQKDRRINISSLNTKCLTKRLKQFNL